jgi:hypothetical protein
VVAYAEDRVNWIASCVTGIHAKSNRSRASAGFLADCQLIPVTRLGGSGPILDLSCT